MAGTTTSTRFTPRAGTPSGCSSSACASRASISCSATFAATDFRTPSERAGLSCMRPRRSTSILPSSTAITRSTPTSSARTNWPDQAARQGVERFVFISTDKSSAPTNVYGITKYLAERLILELSDIYGKTCFVICRFGNIFGSNGSVVRLWLDAARRNEGKIQVTDPDMTRFMFSLEEAAATVDFALTQAGAGDIIIRKMQSVCLRDIISLFDGAKVQVVGKRPGEKMHETLYVKGRSAPATRPMTTMCSTAGPRIG